MTDSENPNHEQQQKPAAETEVDQSRTAEGVSAETELLQSDPAAHDDLALEPENATALTEEDSDEGGEPYGGHSPEHIKQVLEAALFAAGTALSVAQLAALFEPEERPHRRVVRTLMVELMAHYQAGGVQLVEVASGYRFQTRAELGVWVSRLWEERPQRYSRALLETLALIAYRQPITRGEIEDVRGVSVSSSIIKTLQEREWVRVVGHRDVPGRPAMYATTRQFLDYFGLRSLDQLPSLSEIRDLDDIHPELGFEPQGEDSDNAGGIDSQAEISFSAMVDKLREGEREGKTGNEFIDNQLDSQLQEMDAVNESIEQAFEAQRAGHNQPGLELNDESDDEASEKSDSGDTISEEHQAQAEQNQPTTADESTADDAPSGNSATEQSEAEKWHIIQEKLAQQQALLDARESDPSGGDDTEND